LKHRASVRYWRLYAELPNETRQLADRAFEILKDNPRHPSLHLKMIGRFWSVRVGLHYRALAVRDGGDLLWFWIGDHGSYDRLVKRHR
jgi:hypothetical protein